MMTEKIMKFGGKAVLAFNALEDAVEVVDEIKNMTEDDGYTLNYHWLDKLRKYMPLLKIRYKNYISVKEEPIIVTFISDDKKFNTKKMTLEEFASRYMGEPNYDFDVIGAYNKLIMWGEEAIKRNKDKIIVASRKSKPTKAKTRKREIGEGTNATMNRISQNIKAVTKQNLGKFGKL